MSDEQKPNISTMGKVYHWLERALFIGIMIAVTLSIMASVKILDAPKPNGQSVVVSYSLKDGKKVHSSFYADKMPYPSLVQIGQIIRGLEFGSTNVLPGSVIIESMTPVY